MCKFLSLLIENGIIYYADAAIRENVDINFDFDSHSQLANYFFIDEDKCHKIEVTPENGYRIDKLCDFDRSNLDLAKYRILNFIVPQFKEFLKTENPREFKDLKFFELEMANKKIVDERLAEIKKEEKEKKLAEKNKIIWNYEQTIISPLHKFGHALLIRINEICPALLKAKPKQILKSSVKLPKQILKFAEKTYDYEIVERYSKFSSVKRSYTTFTGKHYGTCWGGASIEKKLQKEGYVCYSFYSINRYLQILNHFKKYGLKLLAERR